MKSDQVASYVLALSALAVAVTVVHREFSPSSDPYAGARASLRPVYVENWQEFKHAGIMSGNPNSKIEIAEFTDLECPICKEYEATLQRIEAQYSHDVHRVFVHFPLAMHPHSRTAARAAECADNQGQFARMRDALFAKQDSLGERAWSAYAMDAGVRDVPMFDKCMQSTVPVQRIEDGWELAKKLQLPGTPTLVVNGWKFHGAPPDSILIQTIDDLIASRVPRASKR